MTLPVPEGAPTEIEMTRGRWLERLGFEFDPFEHEVADETSAGDPYIDRYFVQFPYFEEVQKPRTSFLFTRRGCGKSANCIQLERWCARTLQRPDQKPNILAVRHDDFLRVLADISLDSHCQAILHRAVPALLDTLFRHFPDAIDHLSPREREDLTWFVQKFSDRLLTSGVREELSRVRGVLSRLPPGKRAEVVKGIADAATSLVRGLPVEALPKVVDALVKFFTHEFEEADFAGTISPLELLRRFVAVCGAVGIDHVFILVDRVDEFGTEKQVDLLYPLIVTIPMLGAACFKFFLPTELLPRLRELRIDNRRVFREDRIPALEVEWHDEEIAKLLAVRLGSASKARYFSDLVEFGGERWDVDARLVEFAHGSPRDLVRICKRIFSEHTRLPTKKLYIPDSEVKEALDWFSRTRAHDLYKDELPQLIRLPETPFTLDVAARSLKLSADETVTLLQDWQNKGLVKRQPRDPAQPDAAPFFDIADPRARRVWEEEHL